MEEIKDDQFEQAIFVYPTTDLMMKAQYEFARKEKEASHPGLIITFNEFLKKLSKPFCQNKRLLTPLMSRQLFLQILKNFHEGDVLKSLKLDELQLESTAQSLFSLNQQLHEQGADEKDLLILSQKSLYWQDVFNIFTAYNELKTENAVYDNGDIYDYVLNLPEDTELPQEFAGLTSLYIWDFYFSNTQEEKLFAWCQKRFRHFFIDRTPPATWQSLENVPTKIIASFDLTREVQDVLTEIKQSLLSGVKPNQWAIICRKEEPYFSLLRQELESAGLPYSLALRRPLAGQPLIQAIKIVLEALKEPYAINLPKLLRTSILNENNQTALQIAGMWPATGLLGDFNTWLRRLESARQRNKPFDLGSDEESFLGRYYPDELFIQGERLIKKWQSDFNTIPQKATASNFKQAFTQLLELRGLDNYPLLIENLPLKEEEKLLLQKQYQGAYLGFLDALTQMEQFDFTKDEEKIWPLKEYLLNLNEILEETLLPLPYGQPAGISIGTPMGLRRQSFYGVAILGLNEESFPLLPGTNWMLHGETLQHLRRIKPNWPDNLSNMAKEEELLRLSLELGQKERLISYSQRDLQGTGLSPSPFLLLLQWNLPKIQFAQGIASPFDIDENAALNIHWQNLVHLAKKTEKKVALVDRNIKVKPNLIPTKLKQSPTSYNTYMSCPYAYLLSFCLRLQKPLGVSETLSPLDRGTLLHRLFQRLSQVWAEPLYNSKEIDKEKAISLLDETLDEMWLMPDTLNLPDSLWQAEKLLHREILLKWLDEEIALFKAKGNKPAYLEWHFGKDEELKISPDNYPVQGKIDRVDLSPEGQAVLYDYKSGSNAGYSNLNKDPLSNLQLPIYALAWEALMNKEALEAAYYFPGRGKKEGPELAASFNKENWSELKEEAKLLLSRFDFLIAQGHFPIEPLEDSCQHCDFKDFCPKGGDAIEQN